MASIYLDYEKDESGLPIEKTLSPDIVMIVILSRQALTIDLPFEIQTK